jgi:hypothetical protein
MKRSRPSQGRCGHTPPAPGTSREFLERVGRILVECGFRAQKLSREFAQVCRRLKDVPREWNSATLTHIHLLPHVLTYWHREPDYLDEFGRPKPLLLVDEGPSLSKLIARVAPDGVESEIVDTLLRLKAIRRVRRHFVPKDQSVLLEGEALRVHAFLALLSFLRTVDYNVQQGRSKGPRLFERTVTGPRFPISQLEELQQEMRRRGAHFAQEMDAQLARSEVPVGADKPFTTVTIGLYVSHEALSEIQPTAGSQPQRRPRRARKRTKVVK